MQYSTSKSLWHEILSFRAFLWIPSNVCFVLHFFAYLEFFLKQHFNLNICRYCEQSLQLDTIDNALLQIVSLTANSMKEVDWLGALEGKNS